MKKIIFLIISSILLLSSCKDSNPPVPPNMEVTQMSLLYAVNDNNLRDYLVDNMMAITAALKQMPEGQHSFIVYKTINTEKTGLFRAVSGPDAEFVKIREYDRSINSTDPRRLQQVINDAISVDNVESRTLFLWGHGSAMSPLSTNRQTDMSSRRADPKGFGGDNYNRDYMDIDELAESIPNNLFKTIWFDSCYMSNIETIYQLRGKCKYYVGYPTEIDAYGLPYDLVLPSIISENADLIQAAKYLYEFYNGHRPVTVAVIDMSKINKVAEVCRKIYTSGALIPEYFTYINYSRTSSRPYYDFRQYTRGFAQGNGVEALLPDLDRALNDFIIYAEASERDFKGNIIPTEEYSGVSTHIFKNLDNNTDRFYKTLDWYQAVYN